MKLFLCSQKLTNKESLKTLFNKPLSKVKAAVIVNSRDYYDKENREKNLQWAFIDFAEFEINTSELDLRNYKDESEKIISDLSDVDFIWACGGNTFALREAFEYSGFAKALPNLLEKDLVYGGSSAGALVVGPTLKYLDLVDKTDEIKNVIHSGLSLIDFVPLPHWDNESYRPILEQTKGSLEKDGFKVTPFADTQSIIVNGDKVDVVG